MEGSSERISEVESESINFMDDLLEFDSIGSWADEVDSDHDAREGESESTEAIKFNPKYACQAQKLKESLPASSSIEHHYERGQHEHRPHGDTRSHSPPKSKRNSFSNSRDGRQSCKYRSHNRRSGNSHDNFYRSPRSSDSRYKRDRGGISPLRSPLNSRPTRAYHDKHRHYRRQSHGESHRRSQFLGDIDEHCENVRKRHSSPPQAQTVLSEEDEDGTPILSKWQMREPKWARSRRRLCLPEDFTDQTNGDHEVQMEELTKEDEERLARREKDIVYGKSTDSYQKYIKLIPLEERNEDCKIHPRTPLKTRKCSRRSWDAQIRIWKRRVHTWAAESADFFTPQESKYPVSSGPRWADVVAGTSASIGHSDDEVQERATENVDPNVDDDESFLDDFDFECTEITDQMNESVNLESISKVENLPEGEGS